MDQIAYYEQNPERSTCSHSYCHAQEDRPKDDSIPLPGSIPHPDRIRLNNHTLPSLLERATVPGRNNSRVVSDCRGAFCNARWPTGRQGEQEETPPGRNGDDNGSDRGYRIHPESVECFTTPCSDGHIRCHGRRHITHPSRRCDETDEQGNEDGRLRSRKPRRVWPRLRSRLPPDPRVRKQSLWTV